METFHVMGFIQPEVNIMAPMFFLTIAIPAILKILFELKYYKRILLAVVFSALGCAGVGLCVFNQLPKTPTIAWVVLMSLIFSYAMEHLSKKLIKKIEE